MRPQTVAGSSDGRAGQASGGARYDDCGDPDDLLEEVRWMTQADAEKYAGERGYELEEM